MLDVRNRPVALSELSFPQRMSVYWGCYWRAVLFALAQVCVIVPLYVLIALARDWSRDGEPSWSWIPVAAAETCSVLSGFWFVALYVRLVVGKKIGAARFVLVVDGFEAGATTSGTVEAG